MKSFADFVSEEIANCTGPAISGTDPADTSTPKAPLLTQIMKRKKPKLINK